LLAFIAGSLILVPYDSNADTPVDLGTGTISMSVSPSTLSIPITPTPSGTEARGEITVNVTTDNPTGYSLYMNTATTTTELTHTNDIDTIAMTSNTTAGVLASNTWGYNLGLGATTFLAVPIPDNSRIINGSIAPIADDETIVTVGVRADTAVPSGQYTNTLEFTAVTNSVLSEMYCETGDYECILFTIYTDDGTYAIPTSGRVADMNHTYDWDVYVDGVLTTDCPGGNCSGTSGTIGLNVKGIILTGLSSGEHQIKIVPFNSPAPGWGNAFGHYDNTDGANDQDNKDKLISVDSPLTTMAFAPKTTESTTDASSMFANIFYDCTNLTTPAILMDTYKLPNTITNLFDFLNQSHFNNFSLTDPIDLTPLDGWFNANTSITNLANFLYYTHYNNFNLTTPIDLTPLAGWFNANTSIVDLSWFLSSSYSSNTNLTTPIDLTPLAGWFNANTSITNLSGFLFSSHGDNTNLGSPINLGPLVDWFNANNSITNLSWFLDSSHYYNTNLTTPVNLAPLAGWFNANTSIINLSGFLSSTHSSNTNLTIPIDFTPMMGWFNSGRSFTTMGNFLYGTHQNSPNLTLSGQIILPNWIKTVTQSVTPIWNVSNAFSRTFYVTSTKNGDTGEPRFQDGTELSSISTPTSNRQTYTNRSGITPVNSNWK